MKTTIKTFVKKISFALFVAAAFVLPSCNIGLGKALDLTGPTVTITSPEARENVKEVFDISGIIEDDFAVGVVTIELDGNIWQHDDIGWKFKAKDSNDFVPDEKSIWNSSNDGRNIEWTIKDANISGGDGVFTIDVNAVDKTGNKSAESHKSRDIIIDKSAPVITISSPALKEDSEEYKALADYKEITKVSLFKTSDFTISGKTTDENAIKYVDVVIKTEDGSDTEYFRTRLVQDEQYVGEAQSYKRVDSLRSWDVDVKLAECGLKDLDNEKHILKILTVTEDSAGNKNQTLLSHGYACLWKNADVPWLEMRLGTAQSPLAVYSGSYVLGNACDDTAISEVTATIKEDGPSGTVVKEEVLYKYSEGDEQENNVFLELAVPENCKVYYVEIKAKDNNGKTAVDLNDKENLTGYIKVVDKTYPTVEIEHYVGGNKSEVSETLFGDANGKFKFAIIAKDDTNVSSLKMVYIKNPTDIIKYSDSSYEEWNKPANQTSNKAELKGGKIYNFSLHDTDTTQNDNGFIKKVYEASLDEINIFDDLGINGDDIRLSNQIFVFRVEDGNGNAITKDYTILGDIEPPTIEFTKMVYHDGANSKEYTVDDLLPAFGAATFVEVFGKIDDNSAKKWSNGYNMLKAKFILRANEINLDMTVENDGTFKATTKDALLLRGSSLVFDGELLDYAGNSAKEKYAFLVDTQSPRVEYISSTTADGYYGDKDSSNNDQTIDIYIRFNMQMKVTGSNNPTLTLNNGGTATMTTDLNTAVNELHFAYTVKNGGNESTKPLNVTNFTLPEGGAIIKSDDSDTNVVSQIEALVTVDNLASMKDIWIIKKSPELQNAELNETTGVLTLTYDKNVAKGFGNDVNVTITQNSVTNAPAVLSTSRYKTLVGKNSALATYYEEGTNGASSDFKADLSSKYILKYEHDSNKTELVNAYKATKAHILSLNVSSAKVTVSGKTVRVAFGANPLPCKGETYTIAIAEGFVQDANGGDKFKAAAGNKEYVSKDIEPPVIRIDGTTTTVGNDYKATQPMKTHFKVDCQTSGVTLNYSYIEKKLKASEVIPRNEYDGPSVQVPTNKTPDIKSTTTTNGEYSSIPIEIGSTAKEGLIYNITATAEKSGFTTAENYAIVYRTLIHIKDFKTKVDRNEVKTDRDYTSQGYPRSVWKGNNSDSIRRLFIRGGDNQLGANSTSGLPTDWDETHTQKVCMMTEDGNDYYFATWNINVENYYFMFLVGLCDEKTISANGADGISEGPQYFCYAQNCWVGEFKRYPIFAGGYIIVYDKVNTNGNNTNVQFLVEDPGKPVQVR